MEIIQIKDTYIQLNQLLKVMGWCEDGAQSNIIIDQGLVKVNGTKEFRRRNKIVPGTIVEYDGKKVTVIA